MTVIKIMNGFLVHGNLIPSNEYDIEFQYFAMQLLILFYKITVYVLLILFYFRAYHRLVVEATLRLRSCKLICLEFILVFFTIRNSLFSFSS